MKVLIAYHKNCIDGFTSAWVTAQAMEELGNEVDLLPMQYNEASNKELFEKLALPLAISYHKLYVVDFSLSIKVLEELHAYCVVKVTVIDHHKTAFEKYCPCVEVTPNAFWTGEIQGATIILNNNECGASLCWKTLNPDKPVPRLISYVKDYDLWRFELGDDTKYINNYLVVQPRELGIWTTIAEEMEVHWLKASMLMEGKKLQEIHNSECESIAKEATPITILGHEGLAVSCTKDFTSLVGNLLAAKSGTFGCVYYISTRANVITYSLRSIGDFDVSAIAKKFGGGGHKNAASYATPFITEQGTEDNSDV